MVGPFCTPHSIFLTLAFERAVLFGNVTLSIVVLSAKKQYYIFHKKALFFQKIYFKVKVLKMLKISSDCLIKTWQSLKRMATLKIPGTVFRGTKDLSVGFKIKPPRESVSTC